MIHQKAFSLQNRSDRRPQDTGPERDTKCPDCKGKCVDRHGFDCVRCMGEGHVDE